MKRIISLTLAALMLVTLLLTATSCGMESITGYTQLRDHIISLEATDGKTIAIQDLDEYVITISAVKNEDNAYVLSIVAAKMSIPLSEDSDTTPDEEARIKMILNGNAEKAALTYESIENDASATATVYFTHYTGEDLLTFDTVKGMETASVERNHRETAGDLCNTMLKALDTYMMSELGISVSNLGFIVLSDKYMAPVEEAETEEDLGGAFSPARLSKAGLMILQGIGMVFLVLAILWLVLLIFKKVFYKDPAKEEKKSKPAKTEAPASASAPVAEAPVAVAPVADDGALIAAITAAVSAYIESDPALTSQFAGGFRVVSFKPTTKSRNR